MKITQEKLISLLEYNRETGIFKWRVNRGSVKAGDVAGGRAEWGWRIWVCGRFYTASHLAWLYVYGVYPDRQIDHEDRNPLNNAIGNLRLATQSQNKANSNAYKNNKLGIKGVRLHRNGQYEARIRKDGVLIYIGCFRTIKEAMIAYNNRAKDLFGDFASLHPV